MQDTREDRSLDSSEEVRGLVRAGRAAIRVGDYEAARTTFERAVALDPDSIDAQDGLRDAQRRLGALAREGSVETVEYCYRHPETETGLHCVQCGRPICFRCSTPAAVGQLCPECRRGRRAPNYQVSWNTLAKGGAVAFVVSALVSAFIGFVPFFFMFFIAPAIGELVLRAVDWATRNKRGRAVQIVVGVALVAGALAMTLGYTGIRNPLALLLYLVLSVGVAVTRLR
jgi:tetratricopeptide (TPR) repeat protein